MKIKRKNKLLILGTSLLGLGTILGIGLNSFTGKSNNNNEISYIQVNRQDTITFTDNNNPSQGLFYMYYDCIGKKAYNLDELPSDTTNMQIVEFKVVFSLMITNTDLLNIMITPINLDDNTYNTYFDNQTDYVQPFTDYMNKSLSELADTKKSGYYPLFNWELPSTYISSTENPDGSFTFNVSIDTPINLDREALQNAIQQNQNNQILINQLNNEVINLINSDKQKDNNEINNLKKEINNFEIGAIVIATIFVVLCGTIILYFLYKKYKNKPTKTRKSKLNENLLLYSNNIKK